MFITKYERYEEWHPAEGGCTLTGYTAEKSYDVNSTDTVQGKLYFLFCEACRDFGVKEEDIRTERDEWGFKKLVGTEDVTIRLILDYKSPVIDEDSYVDDDGFTHEYYNSWLEVEENDRYGRYAKYIPETEKGIHERPAIYC